MPDQASHKRRLLAQRNARGVVAASDVVGIAVGVRRFAYYARRRTEAVLRADHLDVAARPQVEPDQAETIGDVQVKIAVLVHEGWNEARRRARARGRARRRDGDRPKRRRRNRSRRKGLGGPAVARYGCRRAGGSGAFAGADQHAREDRQTPDRRRWTYGMPVGGARVRESHLAYYRRRDHGTHLSS